MANLHSQVQDTLMMAAFPRPPFSQLYPQRKLALNVMCLIKIGQTEVKIRDKSQPLSKEVSLNKYI